MNWVTSFGAMLNCCQLMMACWETWAIVTCEVPRPETVALPPTTAGPVGFARTRGVMPGCARYANIIRPARTRLHLMLWLLCSSKCQADGEMHKRVAPF